MSLFLRLPDKIGTTLREFFRAFIKSGWDGRAMGFLLLLKKKKARAKPPPPV
jgi:hypothetical protein